MSPLIIGAAALLVVLLLLAMYMRADARHLALGFRRIAGILLVLVTVVLGLTGRIGFAVLTGSVAFALLTGRAVSLGGFGQGQGPRGNSGGAPPPNRAGRMSRSEALSVLGLSEGASADEIRAAHRRLIQQTHPDKGGSNYLAAKINEAKDVLLGK